MDEEGTGWFADLKAFIAECRLKRPLVAREALSHAEEMQCRIIGGSLLAWLQRHGPRLLQERALLGDVENWEQDPFIVFTSQQPGLVAACCQICAAFLCYLGGFLGMRVSARVWGGGTATPRMINFCVRCGL